MKRSMGYLQDWRARLWYLVRVGAKKRTDSRHDRRWENGSRLLACDEWDLETALNNQVEAFNESQDAYEVKPVFQGTYEEALTKFNAVAGSEDAPAIMQTFEVGTKYMIDSNKITPVQDFIDQENFDTSVWEENILSYYQVDGTQYSMPFNSSTPVLIYNKDAFEKSRARPRQSPTNV